MALQLGTTLRTNRVGQIATTIGASGAVLKIWTGAMPANCAAADSGTQLVHIALPNPYFNAASSGQVTMTGTWSEASADATGTAGYFRMYDSGGTCHLQGTVTATGGGGDLTLNNTSIAAGQTVTITSFTLTDGNA